MNYADKIWRMKKCRAEALYTLSILLAREVSVRAQIYGGESDWFFDSLCVSRSLARAGILIPS